VKANVFFLQKGLPTEMVWVYDLRSGVPGFTRKGRPLTAMLPAVWLVSYRAGQRHTTPVPEEIAEWEVPRERTAEWPAGTGPLLARFWEARIALQREVDATIARNA
jgi:hypothetical protein